MAKIGKMIFVIAISLAIDASQSNFALIIKTNSIHLFLTSLMSPLTWFHNLNSLLASKHIFNEIHIKISFLIYIRFQILHLQNIIVSNTLNFYLIKAIIYSSQILRSITKFIYIHFIHKILKYSLIYILVTVPRSQL